MASQPSPESARSAQPFGLPVSPARMYLVVNEGAEVGRCFALEKKIVRLGRSEGHADIVLPDDPRISRRHATVIRLPHPRGAHYVVIDEGSKNGVLVNDQRVEVQCLTPCDAIRMGGTVLDFLPEELLPDEQDRVVIAPLSVDSELDRADLRKPGEA